MSAEDASRLSAGLSPRDCSLPFLGPLACGLRYSLPRDELWGKADACLALLALEPSRANPYDCAFDGWVLAKETGPAELTSAASLLSIGPRWAGSALPGISERPIDQACWLIIEAERFYLAAGDGGPKVLHKTQRPAFFMGRSEICPEAQWPLEDQRALAALCGSLAILALDSAQRPWANPRFGLSHFGLGAQSAFERSALELESAAAIARRPPPRV